MRFTNCPKCDERLKAPDNSAGLSFRCPTCNHTFKIAMRASTIAALADCEQSSVGGNGHASDYSPGVDSPSQHGRILLDADEAMLRDFGNGASFSSQPAPTPVQSPLPSSSLPPSPEPAGDDDLESARAAMTDDAPVPSQIAGGQAQGRQANTGLDPRLAYRLIDVYKAELARMRRISLLAWIGVAVMAILAVVVFWWGMTMSGQAGIERANVANLTGQQANVSQALGKAGAQLDALRDDLGKAQADISALRQALEVVRSDGLKASAQAAIALEVSVQSKAALNAFNAGMASVVSRLSSATSQPKTYQAGTFVPASQPSMPAGPVTSR
jgi:hypothetical protein